MTTELEKLKESMHALVTPAFTGTHEEMIGAVGYWVTMISHLRSLFNIVSGYENRAAIIKQLEDEVGIIKAELDNLSAKITTDTTGQSSMVQPIASTDAVQTALAAQATPAVAPMAEPAVSLNVHQEALQRLRTNAGVKGAAPHPLSKVAR